MSAMPHFLDEDLQFQDVLRDVLPGGLLKQSSPLLIKEPFPSTKLGQVPRHQRIPIILPAEHAIHVQAKNLPGKWIVYHMEIDNLG